MPMIRPELFVGNRDVPKGMLLFGYVALVLQFILSLLDVFLLTFLAPKRQAAWYG